MKGNKFAQFQEPLSKIPSFRISVFLVPLWVAVCGFIWYQLRGKSALESLFFSAFILLFACFVGFDRTSD